MKTIRKFLPLAVIMAAASPTLALGQSVGLDSPPAVTPAPPPVVPYGLKPVIITARHRAERAQSVPVSLTTVDASQINIVGSSNLTKLQQLVPSLNVESINPRQTALNIRGLGAVPGLSADGLEGGVGVYEDGVLLARPAQSLFDLPDLQDIEVLRGPQGTLFGKNTVAGAINITTRLPSFAPEADGSVSYGTQNYVQLKASLSSALFGSDKLALRLSVEGTQHNGYVSDLSNGERYDGQNDKGIRAQLLYDATPNLTVRIIVDYSNQDVNWYVPGIVGIATTYANGTPITPSAPAKYLADNGYKLPAINAFGRTTNIDSPEHYEMETGGATILADYDLNGYTLSSITGARYWNFYSHNDGDDTGLPILTAANATIYQRQASQELRITSPLGGKVDYTGGLYYFYTEYNSGGYVSYGPAAAGLIAPASPATGVPAAGALLAFNDALNGFSPFGTGIAETNSVAAYGQATWHIAPQWDITGGLRYTYEAKTASFEQNQQGGAPLSSIPAALQPTVTLLRNSVAPHADYNVATNNSLPAGMLTVSYKPESNILAYATYSHGAKSAGINLVASATTPKIVAPETIDNYELGLKTTLLDDRLILDGDLFWEEDKDYQGTLVGSYNGTPFTYLASIPKVRSRGVEVDTRAQVTENLSLFFSGIYDNAYNESNPSSPCPIERSNTGASCNLSGRPLVGVSAWTGSFGGEYDYPLPSMWHRDTVAYFSGNALLRTGFYSGADDSEYSHVPGYGIGNINFGVKAENGAWSLGGWIRNVTDAHYYLYRSASSTNSLPDYNLIIGQVGDPITGGVTLSGKF